MSSAAAQSPVADVLEHVQVWAKSLAETLSQRSGSTSTCEVLLQTPADALSPTDSDLWVTAASSGGLSGELSFRMPPASVRRLAGEQENSDQPPSADNKTTVLEFFRKAAALVTAQQKASGRVVEIQVEAGSSPSWDRSATYWLQATLPAQVIIEMRMSDSLLASLQMIPARLPVPAVGSDPAINKLGMLMDVELLVTMRFGGRRMLLKDILDLCTGSVVELDQQVQEPVDLLLDGKLVARGEVVVVDGNYGLRVTELVSNVGH
ncbi:MAG: flagellar motor switch protein FliN [Terriglobales bacterium]